MGGMITEYKGRFITLPWDFKFPPEMGGRLPDKVLIKFDECNFAHFFGNQAAWTSGKGPYLLLAYCRQLTITRHATLAGAIEWKRTIDSSSCGGTCAMMHVIAFCDPKNGFKATRQKAIDKYIKEQSAKK